MSSSSMHEMRRLVDVFDHCVVQDNSLMPCRYHQDRLAVTFYEQPDRASERDIDDKNLELSPQGTLVDLFSKMQQERIPAGHWGLVASHREWLTQQVRAAVTRRKPEQKTLRVLLLGCAGPVHYFGTVKILHEAASADQTSGPLALEIVTVDRCPTPVAVNKAVLAQFEGIKDKTNRIPLSFDVMGLSVALDPSFHDMGLTKEKLGTIKHQFELCDICAEKGFLTGSEPFDLILGHFTFSMWEGDIDRSVRLACRNIASVLKPQGRLLMALSEIHNPNVTDVGFFHERFKESGLRLDSSQRTWDVYDLSRDFRGAFLAEGRKQTIKKSAVLCAYTQA